MVVVFGADGVEVVVSAAGVVVVEVMVVGSGAGDGEERRPGILGVMDGR